MLRVSRATVHRLLCFVLAATAGCGDRGSNALPGGGRIADVQGHIGDTSAGTLATGAPASANGQGASGGVSPGSSSGGSAAASAVTRITSLLAHAAGGADGMRYDVAAKGMDGPGIVVGRIGGGERRSRDTIITPTHDYRACDPFTQKLLPSSGDGVGNAVVWLIGVATGPADTTPRRVELHLDGCRLEPRVQRVRVGSTLMVASHDRMMSRLRFTSFGGDGALRSTVLLNDAGQVVPDAESVARAGLVEVTDDLHPWVHAWLAVAPHPFVAVTSADGQFQFDGVPPGRYMLAVWSEVLGARTKELRVTAGVETRVDVKY
jgi:hypothetical protein